MDEHHIKAMIRALKPVLKDLGGAEHYLTRYWQDKMALVWSVQDVHRAANELELALTNKEAVAVLKGLRLHYNRFIGLSWEDVTNHITDKVLGRKLTKRELHQFVHHDRLTIQR